MTNQMSKWTRELLDLQDSITHLNENGIRGNAACLDELKSLQRRRDELRNKMVREWDEIERLHAERDTMAELLEDLMEVCSHQEDPWDSPEWVAASVKLAALEGGGE